MLVQLYRVNCSHRTYIAEWARMRTRQRSSDGYTMGMSSRATNEMQIQEQMNAYIIYKLHWFGHFIYFFSSHSVFCFVSVFLSASWNNNNINFALCTAHGGTHVHALVHHRELGLSCPICIWRTISRAIPFILSLSLYLLCLFHLYDADDSGEYAQHTLAVTDSEWCARPNCRGCCNGIGGGDGTPYAVYKRAKGIFIVVYRVTATFYYISQ